MKTVKLDLHIHSVYSDGLYTPAQIVAEAQAKDLAVVALTDHDTLDGIPEFLVEAKRLGVPAIYGIEFTCRMNARDVHILGYNFCPTDPEIIRLVDDFIELQSLFTLQRIMNFEEKWGKSVDIELLPLEGNFTPIRLAYWLRETGHLTEEEFPERIRDIYSLFETEDQTFPMNYAPHLPLAEDVVEIIRKAGGFPVLAHPQSMEITFAEVQRLYARGLRGIEAFYPQQDPLPYLDWAARLALAVTAGTDFHGVLDRNERSIGFIIEEELPDHVYFYSGDYPLRMDAG